MMHYKLSSNRLTLNTSESVIHRFYITCTQDGLQDQESSLAPYVEMVEKTIDLEKLDSHVYVIKPEYDKNLEALAGKLFEASYSLSKFTSGSSYPSCEI